MASKELTTALFHQNNIVAPWLSSTISSNKKKLVDTRVLEKAEENKKSLNIVIFESQESHQDRPQCLKKTKH